MVRINRSYLLTVLAALVAMISSGCCCLDDCGIIGCGLGGYCGDCTSYPGSAGCVGDVCGTDCGDCCGVPGGYLGFRPLLGCGPPYGGPVVGLLRLIKQAIVCGPGCGGVYWGEWLGDPPACCDPCDSGCGSCGTYSGCDTCSSGNVGCSNCGGNQLATRNYNWGHANVRTACKGGVCQTHSGSSQMATEGSVVYESKYDSQPVRTTSRPRQFQAGDRVIHVASPRNSRAR